MCWLSSAWRISTTSFHQSSLERGKRSRSLCSWQACPTAITSSRLSTASRCGVCSTCPGGRKSRMLEGSSWGKSASSTRACSSMVPLGAPRRCACSTSRPFGACSSSSSSQCSRCVQPRARACAMAHTMLASCRLHCIPPQSRAVRPLGLGRLGLGRLRVVGRVAEERAAQQRHRQREGDALALLAAAAVGPTAGGAGRGQRRDLRAGRLLGRWRPAGRWRHEPSSFPQRRASSRWRQVACARYAQAYAAGRAARCRLIFA